MNLLQRHYAEAFWNWWKTRSERLGKVRDANDPIFDKAVELLHKYDDALGLEISITPEGQRSLIITAYGNADHRQAVLDLFQLMPALQGWEVVAFRPAQGADFELEIGGFQFSGEKMWFEPLRDSANPEVLGVEMYFEGGDGIPNDVCMTAAGLGVMAVLGELDFMGAISTIRIGESKRTDLQELLPLAQLPQFIEWSKKDKGSRK